MAYKGDEAVTKTNIATRIAAYSAGFLSIELNNVICLINFG